jgi:hypothetical protein
MKKFNEIFGKVMIEVTPTEVAMLGYNVPMVTLNGSTWVEFKTWANKALSPNLAVRTCGISGCRTAVYAIIDSFNEKSASTLKANGFMDYSVTAEEDFVEDGRPCGSCLVLNIPVIPNV